MATVIIITPFGQPVKYSPPPPQLATPENVEVDGTIVSFSEVENAQSYEFFVDGVSIGSYFVGVT